MCRISVVNDSIYEDSEKFVLDLITPDRVLLGINTQSYITLTDSEDGKKGLSLWFCCQSI